MSCSLSRLPELPASRKRLASRQAGPCEAAGFRGWVWPVGRDHDFDDLGHAAPPLTWIVSLIEPSASDLFGDAVALLAGFELGLFGGVSLQELVELGPARPRRPPKLSNLHLAAGRVADERVRPAGQLHGQAGCLAGVEL